MKKFFITAILGMFLVAAIARVTVERTPNGDDQGSSYWCDYNQNTFLNEMKADFNLLRTGALYYFNGPLAKMNTTTGAASPAVTTADGTAVVVFTTSEVIISGVSKILNATAEVYAFSASTDLNPDKAAVYLLSSTGATTGTFAVTKGTEVASTEVAVCPALPASSAAIALIKIRCNDTFECGTTNFNASGVTTTLEILSGPIYTGSSAPTAISATNMTMTN